MAFRGVDLAVQQLGISAESVEPGDGADRESGLRLLAARGFDLILCRRCFRRHAPDCARDYPERHFACVDYAKFDANGFVVPPKNMVALKFREEEGSFLVGAWLRFSHLIRRFWFRRGMDIPLIHKFEAGFRQGALSVCPACKVLVWICRNERGCVQNPARGKELAMAQYRRCGRGLSCGGPRRDFGVLKRLATGRRDWRR